jgi:acyl-coenzyme A thioesterase PaaI-like protein
MADLPAPDWKPVQPFPFAEARKMFTGPTSLEGLVSLRYFLRPDKTLTALATFGPLSEGAPGRVHGGMILTVLDEALGAAAWVAGHRGPTIRLETDFRAAVPVNAQLLVETRVVALRHRVAFVEGKLLGPGGTLYAQAKGRFLVLGDAERQRMFGQT